MNYRTRQKESVLTVLHTSRRPLTVEQIHSLALAEVPEIGLSTVYRLLKQSVEAGEVQRVELPEAGVVYEPRHQEHHHYFVCEDCERILPLEGCVHGIGSLLPKGSRMTRHEFVAYGACPDCAREISMRTRK